MASELGADGLGADGLGDNPSRTTESTEESLESTWGAHGKAPGVPFVGPPKRALNVRPQAARHTDLPQRRFEPGTLLAGRYQVVSVLGRGGMGEVYRAEDLKLGETVALKFLPERVERDARRLGDLLEEARLARQVSHPNICRVHDITETEDGLHFISMEYIDGEDLASLIRRIGRIPHSKALEIARESLQALTAAHDAGVLHRDLKPANIMLDGAGRVRVTDFGLASVIGSQSRGGTPAYMAPELFDGQRGTTQSDLYALGLVFYEVFTGRRAFAASSFDRLADQHRSVHPPTPSEVATQIDSCLDELILRCLDKNPARRPGSLQQLDRTLEGLQRTVEEEAVETPPAVDSFASWTWRAVAPRSRLLVGLLIAVSSIALLISQPWGAGGTEVPSAAAPDLAKSVASAFEVRPGLALLPISNLTGEPDAAWIGLAMTEVLFTELSFGGLHRLVPLHQVDEALMELGLDEQTTFQSADFRRLQRRLGIQRVVVGSYSRTFEDLGGLLRVDLRLVDVEGDAMLANHGATATETQIVELALRVGEAFRRELSVDGLPPEEVLAVRGVLPSDPEAARLYVEGMAQLRRLDLSEARRLLTEALEEDPTHPMPYAALSEVLWKLGFETRARAEIIKAVERMGGLGARGQQEIQARAAKYEHRLDDAIPLLEALVRSEPDRLDYHVDLIEAQIGRGAHTEAQVALAETRRLPSPLGEHPILDHLEARVYQGMGQYQDQQRLARTAAEKAEIIEAMALVAAARLSEAIASRNLGETQAEAVAVERARALYQDLGNRSGTARCLQHLGNSQYRRGDFQGSKRLLLRSKELYEEIGHDLNVGSISLTLAYIEYYQGNSEGGISGLKKAVAWFRGAGNDKYLGDALTNLGGLLLMQGRLHEASTHYLDALELYSSLRNRSRMAVILNNIGEIEFFRGELDGSQTRLKEAQAISRETGDRLTLGYATYRLAEVYRAQGDHFVAEAHYIDALDIFEDAKDRLTGFEVRLGLAQNALEQGDLEFSERMAEESEQHFRRAESLESQHRAEIVLARILLQRNKISEARQTVERMRSSVQQQDQPLVRYGFFLLEAQTLASERQGEEAYAILSQLAEEAHRSGYLGFELEARVAAAEVDASQPHAEARKELHLLLERVESKNYGVLADRLRKLGIS